jgi:hypothetical protein
MGISLGTRAVGVAIFLKGELLDWRLKTFKGPWCVDKLERIVTVLKSFMTTYAVKRVILKDSKSRGRNENLKKLQTAVVKSTKHLKIQCKIKKKPSQKVGFNNRQSILFSISHKFPEIIPKEIERTPQMMTYYIKVVEAILWATS